MSGPKSDYVFLDYAAAAAIAREHQRKLDEERRIKEINLRKETALIRERARIRDFLTEKINILTKEQILHCTVVEINKIKNDFLKKLDEIALSQWPESLPDMEISIGSLEKKLVTLVNEFNANIKIEKENLERFITLNYEAQQQKIIAAQLLATVKDNAVNNENISFARVINNNHELLSNSHIPKLIEEQINEIKAILDSINYYTNQLITSQEKAELRNIADELNSLIFDENECNEKILGDKYLNIIKTFYFFEQKIESDIEKTKKLYEDYLLECHLAETKPQKMSDFANINDLASAVNTIQETNKQRLHHNYIKEQVDNVMNDFGYQIIDGAVIEPAKYGDRSIYQFDDNSAINVYLSNKGSIMMEIVATGDNTYIDEAIQDEIVGKQGKFCDIHPRIVQELARRGVNMSPDFHLEPGKEYVKKIKLTTKNDKSKKNKDKNIQPQYNHHLGE